MKMRVRTFLSYYKEGTRLQAKEYREQLRIARTPAMIDKYYEALSSYYDGVIIPESKPAELPPKPIRPAMDMTSIETKNAVIDLFSRARMRGKLTPYGR